MSKFTDKFLDFMRLGSDEDEYDDYDEYDDEDDYKPRRAETTRTTNTSTSSSRVKNTQIQELDAPKEKEAPRPVQQRPASKVVPMRGKRSMNGMEVCVIKPTSVNDAREITDTLLSGRAVILNMEGIHFELAQRIIDFTSGSCYSMNGNLRKVSNYIFIITPETVDISGDFQDLIDGSVNMSSI